MSTKEKKSTRIEIELDECEIEYLERVTDISAVTEHGYGQSIFSKVCQALNNVQLEELFSTALDMTIESAEAQAAMIKEEQSKGDIK